MDGIDALGEAIRTVPVPGAPARFSLDGAAFGLSFLDTSLRLNHVRRLTERFTVSEHRAAQRTIEVDVSLRLLDEGQRQASSLFQAATSHYRRDPEGPGERLVEPTLWVPVARISRQSVAPVDVRDAAGQKLPRLTQYETSRLLASGLYRLLRGIWSSHTEAREEDSLLSSVLHKNHETRWLIQSALLTLMTDRSRPEECYVRASTPGMSAGQGARTRNTALSVLDRDGDYGELLKDFYALLDIAVNEYLLVVALDGNRDEHLLTYDSPLHVKPDAGTNWLKRGLRANNRGYLIQYQGQIPASLRSYHLVFEVERGINIEQMYLTTDADQGAAHEIRADLTTLAGKLSSSDSHDNDRSTTKILELETQITLRRLADLVRRRRWDASHAGFSLDDAQLPAIADLCRAATAGEAVQPKDGSENNSILVHESVRPDKIADAAREIEQLNLGDDLSLENDPTSHRAHVYWRRQNVRDTKGDQIKVRAGLILRDTTEAGPRNVFRYALALAAITHCLAWFMTERLWPYDLAGVEALRTIPDRGAIIAVLLLVPGFLYTRLALHNRHSITGYLRAVPRSAAHICIVSVAVLAACIAAGVTGTGLMLMFSLVIVLSTGSAAMTISPEWLAWLAERRGEQQSTDERLRLIGAPNWVGHGEPVKPGTPTPDVVFSSWRES